MRTAVGMQKPLLILILATLLCGLLVLPASARRIPPGDYLDTCRDCYVERGWLNCECQRRNGDWVGARMRYQDCPGEIYNQDGRLFCSSGPEALPSGSWRDSCRDWRISQGTLIAECRRNDGDWIGARLWLQQCPGGPVANVDGRLVCGQGRGGHASYNLPGGSWRNSCRRARIEDNGYMWAECRRKNGDWVGSRLRLDSCRGNVGNNDGKLVCD